MAAENRLKDTEFSRLDEDPIIQITKVSPDSKPLEHEMNYEPKVNWDKIVGEITHEYLKFIDSRIVMRLDQMEKSIERLKEKQLEVFESKNEKNIDNDTESNEVVKEELESLIKKYGMKDLTYAIDSITSNRSLTKNTKQK